jgi:hypothetical protein
VPKVADPYRGLTELSWEERSELAYEVSDEPFDRMEFANQALDLVCPRNTRVALCTGRRGVRVEAGRWWGRSERSRWAMLVVPPHASRRAIAVAVASLAEEHAPWALDVLMREMAGVL